MIPLSNKFPKEDASILWNVPIGSNIRWIINFSVRREAIQEIEFSDAYLFVEIEDFLNHYYSTHRKDRK